MNKNCFRILMFFALLMGINTVSFSQNSAGYEDLLVRAPGFDAAKQLELIKSQTHNSAGLEFVTYYSKSDLIHFRVNRDINKDNTLIYNMLPDLNFTIIQDKESTAKILNELTQPKSESPTPSTKHD
jgi:hypothetical protein